MVCLDSLVFHKDTKLIVKPILTIITVVMNDPDGLIKTARSLGNLNTEGQVEYIIWISSRSSQDLPRLNDYYDEAHKIIQGEDFGIFDAMNRALSFASGEYVLFLNARDVILKSFDLIEIKGPSLVPVQYRDYFGRTRFVQVAKTVKLGIPYCHQGMILPRNGYHYDVKYKYGADYLALLNFNLLWPLPMLSTGLVEYDTTGVSTVNRWDADKWTARVITDRFGYFFAVLYLAYCSAKIVIKRIYDIKSKIFWK